MNIKEAGDLDLKRENDSNNFLNETLWQILKGGH